MELSYASFFGDSLTPMKVRVDVLKEAIDDTGENLGLYYTSYNPEDFYNANGAPLAEQEYAVRDNSWTDAEIDSIKSANGYYPPLIIDLDKKSTWNIGDEQKLAHSVNTCRPNTMKTRITSKTPIPLSIMYCMVFMFTTQVVKVPSCTLEIFGYA